MEKNKNIHYSIFRLIPMKQPLNEEFRRMQKLAGLINENKIKEIKAVNEFCNRLEDKSIRMKIQPERFRIVESMSYY